MVTTLLTIYVIHATQIAELVKEIRLSVQNAKKTHTFLTDRAQTSVQNFTFKTIKQTYVSLAYPLVQHV